MAALTEDAAAVRGQAVRVRAESQRLHGVVARRHQATEDAVAAARAGCERARERRARGIRSAWSDLDWELADSGLIGDVLVAVGGR